MSAPDKLYIVTRADLPAGLQAAQAAHAAFEFSLRHPDVMRRWHEDSSYLILLSTPNEDTLLDLANLPHFADVPYALVVEPDLGNEHTSLAVAPNANNGRWFSTLPLLGKELAVT